MSNTNKTLRIYATEGKMILLGSISLLAMIATPVSAQQASADEAEADEFGTITVTARRRDETLDKVPASVAAFSTEQLAARSISTESDLQRAVPGLTIRESLSSNQLNYSLRGQSVDAYSSSSPGVLPYFNEFQVTTTSATSFIDLESVQVIKGPQGTLFGRNTTGGAVLYGTAKPTNDLSGFAKARIGNYDLREGELVLNLPLVTDRVLVRLAGSILRRDGFMYDDLNDVDLGRDSAQTGRISVLLRPSDRLENITMFQYNSTNGTNAGSPIFNVYPASVTAITYSPLGLGPGWPIYVAGNPGVDPAGLASFAAAQALRGPYRVSFNSDSEHRGRSKILTNTTTFEASDDITLKNIVGYSYGRSADSTDVDGTPYAIYSNGLDELHDRQVFSAKQWSEEFQVQGKAFDSRLEYIVGGYLGYEKKYFYIPTSFFDLRPLVPTVPGADKENVQISKNQGLFVHGSYGINDQLKFTAGFRYTWEQVRANHLPRSLYGQLGFAPNGIRETFSKPSWNVGLEYQANSDLLLYVTHRGSWRSGGFNTNSQLAPGSIAVGGALFLPETTKDIEAGLKYNGSLGNTPLRFNVAAYNQWVDNIQRAVYVNITTPIPLGPTALTANVPQAKITGIELEAEIRPASWLTLGANFAYTDARFNKNIVTLFGVTTAFGPFPDTPKTTGSIFAQISVPLAGDMGEMSFRGDFYSQSKFFYSSVNNTINPGSVLPGYSVANFRVNWNEISGSKVGAAFFVKNAFNKTYYTGGLALGSVLGLNTAIPGRPRMYGAEVSVNF
ncbi:TonB-dependent receptor [Sphingorhabdus sp.]|uniref:TonB-dependent receptor n=1 Tax=Sphingorhabdus sp. TaxID=1902408 RepID=UPI0037CA9974